MKAPVKNISIVRHSVIDSLEEEDLIAVEEPLEIRVGFGNLTDRQQKRIAVTMRTPGNDFELAIGFLFTEGLIQSLDNVESVKYCEDLGREEEKGNVVRVELKSTVNLKLNNTERNFYTTSSCGVCGKGSIESIKTQQCFRIDINESLLAGELLQGLSEKAGKEQTVFTHTGGIHSSALFDLEGNLIELREDVGRHNALDKLIGASFLSEKLPLENSILWVSGRASFELVQKASMAGIPIMVAVGAPSSLAVSLAKETGITLIGFLRKDRFNIYSHPNRID